MEEFEFNFEKEYVFDRERYLQDELTDSSLNIYDMYEFNANTRRWVDNLHGQDVRPISYTVGVSEMYKDIFISVNWCKEKEY